MFVPLARLLDAARQPRSRAVELADVRARLRQAKRAETDSSGRAAATRMRTIRIEISRRLGEVNSCAGCVRALKPPRSRATGAPAPFDGGLCCSGDTADVFSDDEIAALAIAGTTPRRLRPPRTEHSGCAFRGDRGCSLDPEHRPNVCARYLCGELRRELAASGELLELDRLAEELGELFAEFARARDAGVQ